MVPPLRLNSYAVVRALSEHSYVTAFWLVPVQLIIAAVPAREPRQDSSRKPMYPLKPRQIGEPTG